MFGQGGHEKIEVCGDYIYHYQYEKELLKKKRFKRGKRGIRQNPVYTFQNGQQRKKRFFKLVLSNLKRERTPYLCTFTFYETLPLARCWIIFKDFIQRLKRYKNVSKDFSYICVPEFQKRGAVHFHVLIWGLDNVLSKERDIRFIQRVWLRGFVDCRKTDGRPNLAGYLAKYLFKAMLHYRCHCQRAYSTSRNILRPVSFTTQTQVKTVSEVLEISESDLIEKPKFFRTKWLGQGKVMMYKIETKN